MILIYKKSKILVQWPKYVTILYKFYKYSCEIVQIRCMLCEKPNNAHWKLLNAA